MPAHSANLQLEMRVFTENPKKVGGHHTSKPAPLFGFVFPVISKDAQSQNWIWRHLQLEYLEGVTVTLPNPKALPDALPHAAYLQMSIHQTQNTASSGAVGIMHSSMYESVY